MVAHQPAEPQASVARSNWRDTAPLHSFRRGTQRMVLPRSGCSAAQGGACSPCPFPHPIPPPPRLRARSDLFPIAVVVMLVDLLESTSIARALALKNNYELVPNREITGRWAGPAAARRQPPAGSCPPQVVRARSPRQDGRGHMGWMGACVVGGACGGSQGCTSALCMSSPCRVLMCVASCRMRPCVLMLPVPCCWDVPPAGLGLANFAGAAFNCYTTTGSFSRSAVNNQSGGHVTHAPLFPEGGRGAAGWADWGYV